MDFLKKKSMRTMLGRCIVMLGLVAVSCSGSVDESNLYVFSGESVTGFVELHPELSKYMVLLSKARSGVNRGSTMDHMLESRDNYICFIPTNDAVWHFVDSITNQKNSDISQVCDSLARVVVFNSIIDNGNVEAYKSTDFLEDKDHGRLLVVINFEANDSRRVVISEFPTVSKFFPVSADIGTR